MEAYCVRCRQKKEMADHKVVVENGRRRAVGKCPDCGTGMNKFLPSE